MRKTTLMFTACIPVTYDETMYTEEQALDAIQKVAEDALHRAIEGRSVDVGGRYTDCHGPSLVTEQP